MIDLHLNKDTNQRTKEMIISLSNYILENNPDCVVFEDVSLQTNVSTLLLLAQIQGAILHTCMMSNIPHKIYKPSAWRKILKFDQGKGIKRPELKKQAKEYVLEQYGLKVKEDICEAICIGRAFLIDNMED